MKIGIAGPIDITPLRQFFPGKILPSVYSFPLIATMVLEMKARGHDVTVFCGSEEVKQTQWVHGENLTLCIIPRRGRRMAYDFYRKERESLTEAMNESDCDLIHAHWTYEFGAAAINCNKRYLITAHDASLNIFRFMLKPRIILRWFLKTLLGIRTAHRAEYLSAVSPYVACHIERWFRPRRSVVSTPNGIQDELLNRHTGKVNHNPVISSVLTGWGKMKNPKSALKAFRLIRKQYPDAIYQLYGGGYEKGGPAHQWAQSHGLDDGVEFVGKVAYEQVLQAMERSLVFLHPALEESFGMSICEAMALGTPVVAGKKSGAVSYVLNEGLAGLLVDVKSPAAIADGVLGLLRDQNKRVEFSQRGREFVRQNFTVTKMMDRYEAAFAAILEERWNTLETDGPDLNCPALGKIGQITKDRVF